MLGCELVCSVIPAIIAVQGQFYEKKAYQIGAMKRYQQLAEELTQAIYQGVVQPGEKLPSVRQLSHRRQLSPSTIFKAYYQLEAQGLITAQARSGYYVNPLPLAELQESDGLFVNQASELQINELIFDVLEANRQRRVVPLGSAFPSPLLFPMARLGRLMAAEIRVMDPWLTVQDIGAGDELLRRMIALRYRLHGICLSADDIVITNGALEALNLCLQTVARPGDAVLISTPCFYGCLQAIENYGLRAIEIPCHPQQGLDMQQLEQAITQHRPTACWLMTNFQNPTGYLMDESQKQLLVSLLARFEIPLIEDDVYAELYFTAASPKPAKAFDQQGLVMHCASFSKCLAPGYRVGWVVGGRYLRALQRLKLSTSLATSVPAQITLAAYLQSGHYDRHLRRLRHHLMLQQMGFMRALQQYFPAECYFNRPQGGYFLWMKLPQEVDALILHKAALQRGISIVPGPVFSASAHYRQYIRLNYGHQWDDQMAGALQTLAALIRDQLR